MAARLSGLIVAFALVGGANPAGGQDVDCRSLKAEIDAAAGNAARSGQFASALRRQQSELDRTRDYADSLGCNSGFLFGGGPPQCESISARIDQMQENIGQLRQQFQAGDLDDGSRRRALMQQYNSLCSAGGEQPAQGPQLLPVDPDAPFPEDQAPADAGPPGSGSQIRALCVRHCDGGFFPITDQATPNELEGLGQLCKALCPNAEASLYTTTAPSGGIETAVAADGTPYTALPAAYKYQKTFDATCSCKPPHQSWVEALAGAEKLLEADKNDVIVTQQMSDAMAQPAAPSPAVRPTRKAKAARKPKPRSPGSITVPEVARQDPGAPPPEDPGDGIMRQLRRGAPTL